ncbi:MAG: bifunctional isocitrate dehydrogenase kinase/phosphatase [Thermoanaerobaculia bacterium]|nr:MAG: bifunctional isocitrate dehydrogenase kinase/phosphatase [Thermoanaerobaculia bacterium]
MRRAIPEAGAEILSAAFDAYRTVFARVTSRAPGRFARRDWHGMQADARERLELYSSTLTPAVAELERCLGPRLHDKAVWTAMKDAFLPRIAGRGDVELAETFFSSASRRVFSTVGVDPAIEFVAPAPASLLRAPGAPVCASYEPDGDTASLVRRILAERALEADWEDLERDVRLGAAAIEARFGGPLDRDRAEAVQVVRPLFFRNKAAYVVGRVLAGSEIVPLVLALTHPPAGVVLDAVLFAADDVSQVFSFTRSYFHVDVRQPYETVRFLKSILPAKPVAELYIAIGYNKHGKTELYRDLLRHLAESDEPFVIAPGDRGMVMEVFTLPSLDVVFKVIKDNFGPPKSTTREAVMEKYRLVFRHDRAGRLIDAQEYEHLEFERARFSPRLLARLLEGAPSSVAEGGGRVAIRHLYTSRRIAPLNLYLAGAAPEAARAAAVEFGQAIKDLAASNVFPGDLLPKNFGVTRHGRVVFYDYDELCPLTDCNFRDLPTAADEEGAADGPSFYVGPRDVFPEEFERFLGLRGTLREAFLDAHADLLTPPLWLAVQERIRAGEFPDFFPYPAARRLSPGGR